MRREVVVGREQVTKDSVVKDGVTTTCHRVALPVAVDNLDTDAASSLSPIHSTFASWLVFRSTCLPRFTIIVQRRHRLPWPYITIPPHAIIVPHLPPVHYETSLLVSMDLLPADWPFSIVQSSPPALPDCPASHPARVYLSLPTHLHCLARFCT